MLHDNLCELFYHDFLDKDYIPLLKPAISKTVLIELQKVFTTGWIGEGEWVYELEQKLQKFLQVKHIVCVNSGTSAIDLALALLNLNQGDEVISSPMTCAATNIPLINREITIQWADIVPHNGLLSPTSVEANITSKTKAILVVDLHGLPAYYKTLREIANKHKLYLIADCAQALGAKYKQQQAPAYADICCYSFQSVKTLTTVDGGAIAFNEPDFLERATKLRWFGIDREAKKKNTKPWSYDIEEAGYKYHMNNISAAIGLANLKYLRQLLSHQQAVVQLYEQGIKETGIIRKIRYQSEQQAAFWVYPLLVDDRDHFINEMRKHGIEISPLHQENRKLTVFQQRKFILPSRDGHKGIEYFNNLLVCLPTGYWLNSKSVTHIIDQINNYSKRLDETIKTI